MNRRPYHHHAHSPLSVLPTSEEHCFSMVHPSPYELSSPKTKQPQLFIDDKSYKTNKITGYSPTKNRKGQERTKPKQNKILQALIGNPHKQQKNKGIGAKKVARPQRHSKELEEANLVIWRMKGKLLRLEAELERKNELCAKQEESLEFLLTKVIPTLEKQQQQHQLLPNGPLGPIQESLIENTFRVGNYDIGRFLGDGFYAKVYLGTHRDTHQKYAVKMICKSKLQQLNQLQQLELELQVLKTVSHTNIVHLEDVMHAPKQVYLVMNLGYKDLYCYARTHGLTMCAIQQVLVGVLKPLAYLHSMGICHLDLKPENILVKERVDTHELRSRHIQLCDFGLCAVNCVSDSPNHVPIVGVSGTPGFFCPEMALTRYAGTSCEGCAADMWSVGCILLELAQGLPDQWIAAYQSYKEDVVKFEMCMRKNLRSIRKRKNFSSLDVHDLVNRLVTWNPKERLTADEALQHEWLQDAKHIISSTRSISEDEEKSKCSM